MSQLKILGKASGGVGLLIVAVICLNIIASKVHVRVDATAEDIYTLSEGSLKIIEGVTSPLTIKFYFSRSNKELPIQVKSYATRVEELLREYAGRSSGTISFEALDPKPDTDDEEWARKYGIQGMALPSGGELFFGAVFLRGKHEVVLPYIDPRREEFLEYDISEAILRSQNPKKSKIGLLSSLQVISPSGRQEQAGEWAFVSELRKNFEIEAIDATKNGFESLPPDIDVLVVYHPKNMSDAVLKAIDQFVLGGGRVVVCVDPMSRIEQMMMQNAGQQAFRGQRPDTSSNLAKLFEAWGIEFETKEMVGDQRNAVMINAGGRNMSYPFYINLGKANLSADSVITSNLNSFLYAEGGRLRVKEGADIRLEALITAGKSSGLVQPLFGNFVNPMMLAANFKSDAEEHILAGIFSGKFKSAFFGEKDKSGKPFIKKSVNESTVLVIADSDFIFDNNAVDKIRFLNQVILRPKNGNLAFLMNAVDYLAGSSELISIRSKGRASRPFTVVQDIQSNAQAKWKKVEEDLSKQLGELQSKLNELQKQRSQGSTLSLSPAQQAELTKFREEERQVRKKRREVRKNLREDIESLGMRLTAMNMLIVPMLLSVFGVFSFIGRGRRRRG